MAANGPSQESTIKELVSAQWEQMAQCKNQKSSSILLIQKILAWQSGDPAGQNVRLWCGIQGTCTGQKKNCGAAIRDRTSQKKNHNMAIRGSHWPKEKLAKKIAARQSGDRTS
jgi:hypothetical protein